MDNMDLFATTERHSELVGAFIGSVYQKYLDLLHRRQLKILKEEDALVHWGSKRKGDPLFLIDIQDVDRDVFINEIIDTLESIQPDFSFFHDQPFIKNKTTTKTAGFPDLVVEVWSQNNTKFDRQLKFDIYSSSPVTEHWYINQDSNIVECWLGKQQLPSQNLANLLVTQKGYEFDLRYLSLRF